VRISGDPMIVDGRVSGSGKSTWAHWQAACQGPADGDYFTPPPCHQDGRGIPLTDDDRWPRVRDRCVDGRGCAAAGNPCRGVPSALKRAYRRS
jgi:gluconate kinase